MTMNKVKAQVIGIDARLINHPGIGRYIRSNLNFMLAIESEFNFVLIGQALDLEAYKNTPNVIIRPCDIPIYSLKEQWSMTGYFDGVDLAHIPHFNAPLGLECPMVVTIHDLIYFHFKEYEPFFGARLLLWWKHQLLLSQAHSIIAVSEATKADLIDFFPSIKKKIQVIHEAGQGEMMGNIDQDESIVTRLNIHKPYFLSVGSIREHKNIHRLLEAYCMARQKYKIEAELVIVGRLDKRFAKRHKFNDWLQKDSGIRYLGEVDDNDLGALYRSSHCFVMPSLIEGFGLPVLEAMDSKTPVIISDTPCLTEIAQGAALVFSRKRVDELATLLYNVLQDNDLRQKHIKKGLLRVKDFAWEKSAESTLMLYRKILC